MDSIQTPMLDDRVVFVLGAGRSGTTLLYKLLALHPEIGFISNYHQRFGNLKLGSSLGRVVAHNSGLKRRVWFNQGGNAYFIKRSWFKRIFPTPVEGECIYDRCGITLNIDDRQNEASTEQSECLRTSFDEILSGAKAKVLVSKRTANNRRISLLNQIFPNARYINLIRDGRDVARSLQNVEWWGDHRIFWDGRTPNELVKAGHDPLSICARNWVEEMQEINNGLDVIPRERIYEVRYEDLMDNPVSDMSKLLRFIGVDMPDEFTTTIKELNLRSTSKPKWLGEWDQEQLNAVMKEQNTLLSEYGYL